jgi:uncharacterized membrane protein YeaQ/YmgE (transglycosylase-associated protein family)
MNDTMAAPILGMAGVGFFGMLIIGFLAGWIAERTMNRDHGILTNILVGIAGSFVGGTAAGILGFHWYGFVGNLVVATLGAIAILWFFGKRERPAATSRNTVDRDSGRTRQAAPADQPASTHPEETDSNLPPIYHAAPDYSEARPPVNKPAAEKISDRKSSAKKPAVKKSSAKRKK